MNSHIDLPDWMEPLLQSGEDRPSTSSSAGVLTHLDTMARQGAWSQIDDLLRIAPIGDMSSTGMMTLLRGTYRFRSRLVEWIGFRDKVAAEYTTRCQNTERLMSGLYG